MKETIIGHDSQGYRIAVSRDLLSFFLKKKNFLEIKPQIKYSQFV